MQLGKNARRGTSCPSLLAIRGDQDAGGAISTSSRASDASLSDQFKVRLVLTSPAISNLFHRYVLRGNPAKKGNHGKCPRRADSLVNFINAAHYRYRHTGISLLPEPCRILALNASCLFYLTTLVIPQ